MSNAKPDGPKHIPALDGVRGVAIVLVLLTHFGSVFRPSGPIETVISRITSIGGLGVDLFFVLSGFLITGILLDSRSSSSYFRTFYMRRLLRIFPLYYFFLVFIFVIRRYFSIHWWGDDPTPGADPRWFLVYLSNWRPDRGVMPSECSHLWSLAVEEQFYLVWPLVVYLVPRRLLGYVCLAGIAASLGLRHLLILRHAWEEMLHRWTPVRMDTLLIGAMLALAFRNERYRFVAGRYLLPVALTAAAAYLVMLAGISPLSSDPIVQTIRWSLPAVAFAQVVYWATTQGQSSRFLTTPILLAFGRYSYGIYVWHLLAIHVLPMQPYENATLLAKLIYVLELGLLSCGFAWLSWNLLENPFLKLKARFSYKTKAAILERVVTRENVSGTT